MRKIQGKIRILLSEKVSVKRQIVNLAESELSGYLKVKPGVNFPALDLEVCLHESLKGITVKLRRKALKFFLVNYLDFRHPYELFSNVVIKKESQQSRFKIKSKLISLGKTEVMYLIPMLVVRKKQKSGQLTISSEQCL